jgi:hypothetical protein
VLTPNDKLQRGGNDIIQVVITRACDLFTCSNCTQLLPFRSDVLHMSPDVFRLAVRSLADWPGVIGIFGGNPCCHPKFPELMEILEQEIPDQRHRGLWTNNFRGHGQLIQRVFYPNGRFNLNAHADPMAAADMNRWVPGQVIPRSERDPAQHAAILADYRDLNITEAVWVQARERCDINQKWSGAIAERDGQPFAYFCEVASSLDGIRGQNHGIPATPGWWRLPMAAYSDQVKNCCDQGCGVPLRVKGHLDRDDVYDMSATWLKDFPSAKSGRVRVSMLRDEQTTDRCDDAADYMRRWTK